MPFLLDTNVLSDLRKGERRDAAVAAGADHVRHESHYLSALESGKKAQARNDVQQIAAAIRAFELEYGRQPDSQTSSDQWISANSTVMKALLGEDTNLNPR